MALIPFKLTAHIPYFLCLPFPKVRPTINLVICGPDRLRGFQRLLLAQPRLPTLWDVLCGGVEMVHDEGDALWKRLILLLVYHSPASRQGTAGKSERAEGGSTAWAGPGHGRNMDGIQMEALAR